MRKRRSKPTFRFLGRTIRYGDQVVVRAPVVDVLLEHERLSSPLQLRKGDTFSFTFREGEGITSPNMVQWFLDYIECLVMSGDLTEEIRR